MSRLFSIVLLACAVLVTACADGDSAEGLAQPIAASTTTAPAPSTAPPSTTLTDSAASSSVPETTEAETTTTSLVTLDELSLELQVVASGFSAPVFVTSPPGDSRLFVVDQPGVIWVIDGGDPEVFLDIRDSVIYGGERGLLGLAFDPAFVESGLFYVNYTGPGGDTRISEFSVVDDAADPSSERIVLGIDQPASNHNGGMIAFGPDRLLWIGMGDGGGRDDRYGNGQDGRSLLGSMLRIDPMTEPYSVPPDNPGLADGDMAPEVWAIGLRNPWRFSFDGDRLWIADVGQNAWEEINTVDRMAAAVTNFGWPRFEGSNCYIGSTCDAAGLIAPVYEYPHAEGCSVTGGYVYRGDAIPELDGHYIFGDHCSGWVRGLTPAGEVIEWFARGTVPELSSFGVDGRGELYVMSVRGSVYKLAREGP